MKPLFAVILSLFFLFTPHDSLCASQSITSQHFEVRYESIGEKYAELVSQSAERSFGVITDAFDYVPERKITITLTSTDDEFLRLTRGTVPDWSAAVAVPGNRIIISPLPGLKMNIERILAHEIVHSVINSAAGNSFVPRWFHEGCAESFSGRWGIRGRLYMVWKVSFGGLLSFGEIERLFSASGADVTLAYDQSMLAVKRLVSVHGVSVLPRIVSGLRGGGDFGEAFIEATGLTVEEFERDYLEAVGRTYGRRALYTFIPGTWTIILLLAVVVYVIKKRRAKRLLSEWEIVEAAENIIRFDSYPPDE